MVGVGLLCNNHHSNKCIGDDTKAAARQSLNCIKNQKIKSGEERLLIWRMEFLHPAMWHVALESCQWIHQVAAPCSVIYVAVGWHAIEFAQTSVILEFYIWFRLRPHHHSRHVILHQSAKFYPNWTTLGRKTWCHVDFQDGWSQPFWILGVQ